MRRLSRPQLFLLVCVASLGLSACGSPETRKARYLTKGRAFLEQNNLDKARIEFRNALQTMPNDAEARFENGVVAERLGNARDALSFYQGALELNPDYTQARFRQARLLLVNAAPERALEVVTTGLEKHPDDPQLLTVRAGARARTGDAAGALADAERAYHLTPTSEDTIAVLAGTYTAQNRRDDAIKVLETGIVAVPATVDLRMALTQSYLAAGRPADAEKVLKDLVRLQPDQPTNAIRLAGYYAYAGRDADAEATLRESIKLNPKALPLKLALVQLITGRKGAQAGERELLDQVQANPKTVELRFALAQFYADQNQPAKAEATLRDIIKSEGSAQSGVAAKDALALIKVRSGDVAGADALIADVMRTNPRDTQALTLRAELALNRGDATGAIADLRAVLRDQPNSVPILRALARAHQLNAEPPQAEEVLRRAMDLNPTDTAVRLDLVDLLARTGKTDQARPIAEALAKAAPGNPNVLESLFRVQMVQGDKVGAAATAQLARTSHPDLPLGDFLAGLVQESDGKLPEAMASYAAAIDKNAAAEEPVNALGRLSVRLKKTAEFTQRLQKITTEHPTFVQPWQLLGEIALGEHRYPDAVKAFETAITLAPQRLAAYRGLSLARIASGDADGGVAALKDAVAKVSQPDDASFELAATYQRLGKFEDAAKIYDGLLARNPKADAAANNLAMLLAERNDPASLERAKTLSQRFATSANPRYVDTYGWVLIARHEYPQALVALAPLVDKQPAVPAFRYHLALAQIKSGDVAAGRANLQQALKNGDQFEGGAAARALLDSLPKS